MLEWFTAVAAAVAAVGAVVTPIVVSRSSTRDAEQRRQQEEVDRYVEFALDPSPAIATMGQNHLSYLRGTGKLTPDQSDAVVRALETVLALEREAVEGAETVQTDPATDGRHVPRHTGTVE